MGVDHRTPNAAKLEFESGMPTGVVISTEVRASLGKPGLGGADAVRSEDGPIRPARR